MDMTRANPPIGVLLMAYGTPQRIDEVEEYFTHIRGGRTPSREAVEDLTARYICVGGTTPLLEISRELGRRLDVLLSAENADSTVTYHVYVGMKHWHPYISDVMARMAAEGITRVIALALAPHYSKMSIGGYRKAVEAAQEQLGHPFDVTFVESWGTHPGFVRLMAALVRQGLEQFPAATQDRVMVVFTAHSLPERIRTWQDPYERQLLESSALVARQAGVRDWRFAFQSAGGTGEPWIGPDILVELNTLHDAGVHHVLQVPIGFVSDHLEVLYDIDVEAKEKAAALGMTLQRTELPNVRAELIDTLADIVREHVGARMEAGRER